MIGLMTRFAFLMSILFFCAYSQAETTYIQVGKAKTRKTIVALPQIEITSAVKDSSGASQTILKTIKKDLLFMGQYYFVKDSLLPSSSVFIEGQPHSQSLYAPWDKLQTDILVQSKIHFESNRFEVYATIHDIVQKKVILRKKYTALNSQAETTGHQIANDIVHSLTGLPGIFLSKIVTACENKKRKEIYVMDFDGSNVKQVTHHRSIAFAPTFSPDGDKIAYSLYTWHQNKGKRIQNIDLFELTLSSKKIRLLSNRRGINSGAAYSPDGKTLALTMSFLGNPELFSMNLDNRTVKRLTSASGFDVDPNWSTDAKELAFVSSRSGKPMIFKLDLATQKTQRLTYAGHYNATPSWSPQNNKITFAGWLSGRFDIFTMNTDGTKIERLTQSQGNNEDPSFSPDGNFITFSSNRSGGKNLYVMNLDGTSVRRLTYGLGQCVAPKWSN